MAGIEPEMLRNYKALINDGFARSFGDGMALEAERSVALNGKVSAAEVEARRRAVTDRGRGQAN